MERHTERPRAALGRDHRRGGDVVIWAGAGEDGVHCYAPDGTLLGKIRVPEIVANLTFGGPKRNRMFIAANTSLFSLVMSVTGAQPDAGR